MSHRILYSDLISDTLVIPRRSVYVEADNLEKAFLAGKISDKEYDEQFDALMQREKDRALSEAQRGRHDW